MRCLTVATDPGWAQAALRDLDRVLVDHAHCEMKAASNALALLARHCTDARLVKALGELAQDELAHFARVNEMLERRGLSLGPPPVDAYAVELRRAQGKLGPSPHNPLVDRLLVGAMIEARSCERFRLLAEALGEEERELRELYIELLAAEARHYVTFVDLAVHVAHGDRTSVEARLAKLSELEGVIVQGLATGKERAAIHG